MIRGSGDERASAHLVYSGGPSDPRTAGTGVPAAGLPALRSGYPAAPGAGDVEALTALAEPDAVVWHNHAESEGGVDQANRTVAWLHRTVPDLTWEDVAVRSTVDGFVWRAILTGTAPGGPLRAHTCVVATVSDRGLVARLDEYLDPAAVAVLSG